MGFNAVLLVNWYENMKMRVHWGHNLLEEFTISMVYEYYRVDYCHLSCLQCISKICLFSCLIQGMDILLDVVVLELWLMLMTFTYQLL